MCWHISNCLRACLAHSWPVELAEEIDPILLDPQLINFVLFNSRFALILGKSVGDEFGDGDHFRSCRCERIEGTWAATVANKTEVPETQPSHRLSSFWRRKMLALSLAPCDRHGHEKENQKPK